MCFQDNISDPHGRVCGKWEAVICRNESELDECIRFSRLPEGFSKYRQHIPIANIWPMAVLNKIHVDKADQGRGFGRAGLSAFYDQARQTGALLAFGKVGWSTSGDDVEKGMQRSLSFYERGGWVLLPRKDYEPYFVYRELGPQRA